MIKKFDEYLVEGIGNDLVNAQDQIAKLKEKYESDQAALKEKFDTDLKALQDRLKEVKTSGYAPREGSCTAAMVKFLQEVGEATETEIYDGVNGTRPKVEGGYVNSWSGAGHWNTTTMSTGIRFLMEKGVIEREQKKNPKTNRNAYYYKLK